MPTNLERIRAMEADRMAQFIEEEVFSAPWCDASEEEVDPITKECKRGDCVKCCEDWLNREADDIAK